METCKAKKIQLQDVVIVVVFLKKKKKKSGNAEKQGPTYLSQIVYTEFLWNPTKIEEKWNTMAAATPSLASLSPPASSTEVYLKTESLEY